MFNSNLTYQFPKQKVSASEKQNLIGTLIV